MWLPRKNLIWPSAQCWPVDNIICSKLCVTLMQLAHVGRMAKRVGVALVLWRVQVISHSKERGPLSMMSSQWRMWRALVSCSWSVAGGYQWSRFPIGAGIDEELIRHCFGCCAWYHWWRWKCQICRCHPSCHCTCPGQRSVDPPWCSPLQLGFENGPDPFSIHWQNQLSQLWDGGFQNGLNPFSISWQCLYHQHVGGGCWHGHSLKS